MPERIGEAPVDNETYGDRANELDFDSCEELAHNLDYFAHEHYRKTGSLDNAALLHLASAAIYRLASYIEKEES